MLRWLGAYWKSIAVLFTIFFLSFMNPPSIPSISTLFSYDKIAHLIMYAGFTFIILYDTSGLSFLTNRRNVYIYLGIVFPVFIGGLTEVLQTLLFAPRAAEWGDFISDTGGVVLGWLLFGAWRKWRTLLLKN